jgi:hypothetical protein
MRVFVIALSVLLTACSDSESYTLYRDSLMIQNARIHVATFDSADGEKVNQENCFVAAKLFQHQDGVQTKFWCEKGKFKK